MPEISAIESIFDKIKISFSSWSVESLLVAVLKKAEQQCHTTWISENIFFSAAALNRTYVTGALF